MGRLWNFDEEEMFSHRKLLFFTLVARSLRANDKFLCLSTCDSFPYISKMFGPISNNSQ